MDDQKPKKHIGAPFGNQNSKGHGAPKGNKNAKGHGAPLFNTNGWKHGIYAKKQVAVEVMYVRYCERCRRQGIEPDSPEMFIQTLRNAARDHSGQ